MNAIDILIKAQTELKQYGVLTNKTKELILNWSALNP